jgi:hypothetical protein
LIFHDHRPHPGHFREAQRVFGVGRDSGRPALNSDHRINQVVGGTWFHTICCNDFSQRPHHF